ncbi:MAG TPA: hypothetical protein VI953_01395 [Candidatus Paceibacterota bacterium]
MSKHLFKISILLVVLNLGAVVLWFVLLSRTKAASASVMRESEQLLAENSKEAYLSKASRDLRASEKDQRYLMSLFVEEGSEVSFLERVEALGRHAGAETKIIDFAMRGDQLHLAVQAKGSFQDIYYFLRLVESLPFALSIDSATFKGGIVGEKGEILWEGVYSMTLSSFLPRASVVQDSEQAQ